MQLTIISLVFFLLVLVEDLSGQFRFLKGNRSKNTKTYSDTIQMERVYEKPAWKVVDINFLSSYYSQDGNNSPVTGGIGTEQLTDFTQKISVSIPLNQKFSLNLDGGYDYYSSASTDQIDNVRSSDSAQDMRVHSNVGASFKIDDQQTFGLRVGGSSEYDYLSINGGFHYLRTSLNKNTSVYLTGQAFIDQWTLYYPSELRRQGPLVPTDKRQSYNASLSVSQVINKRMQASVQLEGVYMNGLLSTPFHRVYFQDLEQPKVEKTPSRKMKIPLGLRLNNYWGDKVISRFYYRFYWDDWGMIGHTTGLELPIKLSRFVSIAPHYRYHVQTAADYFAPFGEHISMDEFYTSDFDLSGLSSHTLGIGLNYSPVDPIIKIPIPFSKRNSIRINSIDLKYSYYHRSTGLKANIISIGFGIGI